MLMPNIKKIASTLAIVTTINTPTMGVLWLVNNNLMAAIESNQAGIERNQAELVILRKDMNDGQNELRKDMNDGQNALRKDMINGQNELRKDMNDGQNQLRKDLNDGLNELREGQNQLLTEVRSLTTRVIYTEKRVTRLDDIHQGATATHGYHPETPQ